MPQVTIDSRETGTTVIVYQLKKREEDTPLLVPVTEYHLRQDDTVKLVMPGNMPALHIQGGNVTEEDS
jgi:hypothetical protein